MQRVDEDTWEIVHNMAEKGGWEDMEYGARGKGNKTNGDSAQNTRDKDKDEGQVKSASTGWKRKAVNTEDEGSKPKRRSTRTRK